MEFSKKRIPQQLLEEIVNGEKNIADYYDTYGKMELEAAVEELQKDNEEILADYPVDSMKTAVMGKLAAGKNRNHRFYMQKMVIAFSSMAAAIAVVLILPFMLNSRNDVYNEISEISSTERIKGNGKAGPEPQLYVYQKKGNEIVKLENGVKAVAGDCVQISYKNKEMNYGYIFSVDGNGCITSHYPSEGSEAEILSKGMAETALDFSYVLDDAPAFECFVFVTSEKPFAFDAEEMEENYNLKVLKTVTKGKYLPENTQFTTFVLKK
ncbi:MAG: hypothetical protein MJ162_02520 [Treponema sp.]|nr:hypothetical protein [Treponema sp.]